MEAKEALTTRAGQLDAALREDALRQKKRKFEAELKVPPFHRGKPHEPRVHHFLSSWS